MFNYFTRTDFIYNTNVTQKIYCNKKDSDIILSKAYELMKEFERKLNFYDANSEVSKINSNAGKYATVVSKDTFTLIEKSKDFSCLTSGLFDITIAPLVREWAVNSDNPKILTREEIYKILPLVSYKDIELDKVNSTVFLPKKGQLIDLGGIAKGYIADKIIDFYKENGVSSAMINLGGNIKTLAYKDNGELWDIGILEPVKHSNRCVCSIKSNIQSIVTSGIYERTFIFEGKNYPHIINPKSGLPVDTDLLSVSIIDNESIKCDALATPLVLMGLDTATIFMKMNNIKGILLTKNKEIIVNKDLISNIKVDKDYTIYYF